MSPVIGILLFSYNFGFSRSMECSFSSETGFDMLLLCIVMPMVIHINERFDYYYHISF